MFVLRLFSGRVMFDLGLCLIILYEIRLLFYISNENGEYFFNLKRVIRKKSCLF